MRNLESMKMKGRMGALVGRVEKYDVVSGIAQANSGISVGQQLRGSVNDTVKAAKKLFAWKRMNIVLASFREEVKGPPAESDCESESNADEPKKLKLAKGPLFGSPVMALLLIQEPLQMFCRPRFLKTSCRDSKNKKAHKNGK